MEQRLKNFSMASVSFVMFAIFLVIFSLFFGEEISYIISIILIILISIAEYFEKIKFSRGFIKYSLIILLPSIIFPLDDLGFIKMNHMFVYICMFTMVLYIPIIWYRIFTYKV